MNKKGPKSTFGLIFFLLTVFLMILPLLTTFNELLTEIVRRIGWYRLIEETILPFETRMIVANLKLWGQPAVVAPNSVSLLRDGIWQKIIISWNCIGWQSLLVLMVTLITGLQGNYSPISKLECLLAGIMGTFLINIARISLTALLIVFVRGVPATIIHDYSSVIILILWLFFFWWFSYSFILEPSKTES